MDVYSNYDDHLIFLSYFMQLPAYKCRVVELHTILCEESHTIEKITGRIALILFGMRFVNY
jgi:hypothetical protein